MSLFALCGAGHVNTRLEYRMGNAWWAGLVGGLTRIGKCRTYLSVAPAIRSQRGTGVANSSIDCSRPAWCSAPEVADSGGWKKLPDGHGSWWCEGRRWLTGTPKMRWLTCTVRTNLLMGSGRCERARANIQGCINIVTLVERGAEMLTSEDFSFRLLEVLKN